MEARWGKEGVRQYVFALRRSVIGGSDDAYEEAFQMSADEWDQQFDRYMKERFKPFRDKERPVEYGRDLAPDPRKSRFNNVLSIEPSPSGDLIAAVTANGRDRELDIVLVSAKDGQIIRNLTSGFDQSMGFEYLATPGGRWNSVPWLSWSPQGDRLAYFVRTEKDRSLIVQNVITRRIEQRVPRGPEVDLVELRKRVGMVFQKSNPFPKSVYENVAYGLRIAGIADRATLDAACEKSLRGAALWDEVKDRLHESGLGLSGGQMQRLCIARAIAVEPEIAALTPHLAKGLQLADAHGQERAFRVV